MKRLRNFLDKKAPLFEKGGKLHLFHSVYELVDAFLYTPPTVTRSASHIRDGMDLKRMMIMVAVALIPAMMMAAYNTGYQTNFALQSLGVTNPEGWRAALVHSIGFGYDPKSLLDNVLHGLTYFLPVFLVTSLAGGFWEVVFATVKKHDVNEGFFVTMMLFPCILPATIPLWQVAIGISFAVVIGKEIFGGTGMNVFNPALIGRAFLFFAYPAQMSGNSVWVGVDGFTLATPLGAAAEAGVQSIGISWWDAFWGFIPGSMGETSTAAILLGALILVVSGIGSWRIIVSVFASMFVMASLLNLIGSDTNPMFSLTPIWHMVLGGFAFGAVFMATDPVSSAMTNKGRIIYGCLIGVMVVLVRVINPAFPEGMMLAILLGNSFAPVIDNFVVRSNIKRRKARYGI